MVSGENNIEVQILNIAIVNYYSFKKKKNSGIKIRLISCSLEQKVNRA